MPAGQKIIFFCFLLAQQQGTVPHDNRPRDDFYRFGLHVFSIPLLLIQIVNIVLILGGQQGDVVAVKPILQIGGAGKIAHRGGPFPALRSRTARFKLERGGKERVADIPWVSRLPRQRGHLILKSHPRGRDELRGAHRAAPAHLVARAVAHRARNGRHIRVQSELLGNDFEWLLISGRLHDDSPPFACRVAGAIARADVFPQIGFLRQNSKQKRRAHAALRGSPLCYLDRLAEGDLFADIEQVVDPPPDLHGFFLGIFQSGLVIAFLSFGLRQQRVLVGDAARELLVLERDDGGKALLFFFFIRKFRSIAFQDDRLQLYLAQNIGKALIQLLNIAQFGVHARKACLGKHRIHQRTTVLFVQHADKRADFVFERSDLLIVLVDGALGLPDLSRCFFYLDGRLFYFQRQRGALGLQLFYLVGKRVFFRLDSRQLPFEIRYLLFNISKLLFQLCFLFLELSGHARLCKYARLRREQRNHAERNNRHFYIAYQHGFIISFNPCRSIKKQCGT